MSRSHSDEPPRAGALAATAATLLFALAFHAAQNRLALTGGGVAFSKSVWLGLAVLFWLVLPAALVADRSLAAAFKWPFALLLALMATRGLAELAMLYRYRNWRPAYGIAHDLLCLAAMALAAMWLARHRAPRWLWIHALATGALFIPEIGYAGYMQANFVTHGDAPVYFVPDDGLHRLLLGVTAAVDVVAIGYLAVFLHRWLYGHAERARS